MIAFLPRTAHSRDVATHLKKNRKLIKKLFFILIISITLSGFSQSIEGTTHQILNKSHQIDSELGIEKMTKKFEIDSVKIKSIQYSNKINCEITFQNSGNKLTSNIYLQTDKIILIRIIEKSRIYETFDDARKETEFYFKEGILIDEKMRMAVPSGMHLGNPENLEKGFGYNPNLTSDYLKKLTSQIMDKITE